MLTVAFGIYAIAVLGALLVAGRLSDRIGRRPVLLAAAATQALAMAVVRERRRFDRPAGRARHPGAVGRSRFSPRSAQGC